MQIGLTGLGSSACSWAANAAACINSLPICTSDQLTDPTWSTDSFGVLYNPSDQTQQCNPGGAGASGGSLLPGISNGLLVGSAVALIILLELSK